MSGSKLPGKTTGHFGPRLLVLLVVLSASPAAWAQACRSTGPYPPGSRVVTAMPASLIVRPGDPIGHVYFTLQASQPAFTYADCGPGGRANDTLGPTLLDPIDGYWPAGVAGLGWRLQRNGRLFNVRETRTIGPGRVSSSAASWSIALVRTAATVGSGRVNGPLVRGEFSTGSNTIGIYWQWTITGGAPITVPTCSVQGTTIALGNVSTNTMTAVGSTSPTSAASNLRLTCSNNPAVDMRLTTAPIAGTPNVLAISGGSGAASGIGVQLIYNNAVLAYNTNYRVSNAAGPSLQIPLAARYYRTGAMRPGTANGSAVVQLIYP